MMGSKIYYLLGIIICGLISSGSYGWSQSITALKPLQASSFVLINDCNLSLLNPNLLSKRLGNDPSTSFWSVDDIIFAYNKTVSHPGCGGDLTIGEANFSTSLVDNLCMIALAKLEQSGAEKYGITSYLPAKQYRQWLGGSGTSAQGIIPGLVKTKLQELLGPANYPHRSYATPERCGAINVADHPGLGAIYAVLVDSIHNIVTDCGSSVSDDPTYLSRIASMVGASESLSVFGVKLGGRYLSTQLVNCQAKIEASYQALIQSSQNIAIIQEQQFVQNTRTTLFENYQQQNDIRDQRMTWMKALISDATKQTPTTPICTMKG